MLTAKSIKTQLSHEQEVTKTDDKISKTEQERKRHFLKKLITYLKLEKQNTVFFKYMKNWTVSYPQTYAMPEPDLKPD